MQISIQLLKVVIDSQVSDIKEHLEGKRQPKLDKFEAIDKLGTLSALVITLYEKVEEPLKEEVWKLKDETDTLLEKLFSL